MEKLKEIIRKLLIKNYSMDEVEDGLLEYEFYADYRDTISGSTVNECMEDLTDGETPMSKLLSKIDDWYDDTRWQTSNDFVNEVTEWLEQDDENFPEGLSEAEKEAISEIIDEIVIFRVPVDHYLKQSVYVNIMVDTGDGNGDFVANHVYPAYDGRIENDIEDEASLVWLAQTQGYSKEQLKSALDDGDMSDPKI